MFREQIQRFSIPRGKTNDLVSNVNPVQCIKCLCSVSDDALSLLLFLVPCKGREREWKKTNQLVEIVLHESHHRLGWGTSVQSAKRKRCGKRWDPSVCCCLYSHLQLGSPWSDLCSPSEPNVRLSI